jgi:hypothetical protein
MDWLDKRGLEGLEGLGGGARRSRGLRRLGGGGVLGF